LSATAKGGSTRGSGRVAAVAILALGALGVGFTTLALQVAVLERDALARGAPEQAKAAEPASPTLWFYCSTNLLVDENVAKLEELFARAGKAGYARVLLADSKFSRLGAMEARYFKNVERTKAAAKKSGLEIVPAVFPLGYSEGLLSHDPNLAEALPVKDEPFVVKGGVARIATPPVSLTNIAWRDETFVAADGGLRAKDPKGNARVVWKLKLAPFRQYHVSVAVATKEFDGEARVQALAGERGLVFSDLGVKKTQEKTVHHAVFNTMEFEEVSLYVGAWGASRGELWIGDVKLEEAPLLNVVRRDGAPLEVRKEEGGKPGPRLTEGKEFEKVADPKMGCVPWPGAFEIWHEPPPLKAKLPDGTRLRVSYFHAITTGTGQVMVCPSERKTVELLKDDARRIQKAFGNRAWFMSHDEIRVLNQDESCRKRRIEPGRILASNVIDCLSILRQLDPKAEIFVWSDMFDPSHNAHADYYLVRGDLKDSWAGIDGGVTVANWNFDKRDESLAFFAGRGHHQLIAGYYDQPATVNGAIPNLDAWLASAKKVKDVDAVMYTTWQARYDDLERFAERVRAAAVGK
jgi:hypothetical protein